MAKEKVKIVFTMSPTGRFNLGYSPGETAELNANQAKELVDSGYADYVKEEKAKASKVPASEKAVDPNAAQAEKR
jgi:hypothetical protein